MASAIELEIRELIQEHGRITFAQFQQICLYSPRGGFYSSRTGRISAEFRTSPTSHPVFGALIARQLEQMWNLLGRPARFHLIEVGSGDGALARSIMAAARRASPGLAEALYYVAVDYQPAWPASPDPSGLEVPAQLGGHEEGWGIQRVKAEGLAAFRNVAGCVLSNELFDNFPVHRFVMQDGHVKEVFVTVIGDSFTEVLGEPSTPRLQARLADLGLSLPEGFRGEINLAAEGWIDQLAHVLERGFVLTIDYGELAEDLYSSQYAQGALVCYHQHQTSRDPYHDPGEQDITSLVDFTSLRSLSERRGLTTVGYARQREFLQNLGFSNFLDALDAENLSYAHKEFRRVIMMAMVDPDDMGDFKVLAQAKGVEASTELLGFTRS